MRFSVIKDLFREIKNTFGRFIAIFAIVAIGTAFFAGVSASSNDMKYSSDYYYDEYNMSDLRLLSSIGFNDEDIKAIEELDCINSVYAGYSVDAVTKRDEIQSVVHVISIPEDTSKDNEGYINQLRIKEGRLPENEGECVVRFEDTRENYKIGDVINLSNGNTDEVKGLERTEFTVVGIIYTPYYVSYDLGTSDIGSGKVNYLMAVSESEFNYDCYTEAFCTVSGAKELDTYSDEYEELIDKAVDKVDALSEERINERSSEILAVYDEAVEEAVNKAKDSIYQNVVAALTEEYQKYYVGMDVSGIIAPLVDEAYKKAVESYDFNYIYDQSKEAFEKDYGKIEDWEWFELSRQEQYSYRDYESSADRMKAIATVFPIFFMIVSALVCLTTMSRLVAEEREIIGTYKALGYSKRTIAFKYNAYAFIASFFGGVFGCLIGLKLFPTVIYEAWNIIYQLPSIHYDSHILLSVIAVSSMVIVTVVVTAFACDNELAEVPAELLRPKAPKSGKKILLERIGFIWKRFSFSFKVTMRNLFLYKNRFFMTVIGISGCTALILAGFGIKDSVSKLVVNQFENIIHYDSVVSLPDDISDEDCEGLLKEMSEDDYIDDYLLLTSFTSKVSNDSKNQDCEIDIVDDKDVFKDYVTFRTRSKHKAIELSDEGVIITEKLSKDLGLKEGDKITITDNKGDEASASIIGVTEMYVNHYLFISSQYYEELFGETPKLNTIFAIQNDVSDEALSYMGEKYLSKDYVKGISFVGTNAERFEHIIGSLGLVTWVLILSAGLLAFVVLYNLTNVNISERRREIATIKVLGFYDPEAGMYVFRENMFLTLIGGLFGLVLGRLLHIYIMTTVEMESVMFGYSINISSYLITYGLTILLSLLINFSMYGIIKKLPMVESLKSIE